MDSVRCRTVVSPHQHCGNPRSCKLAWWLGGLGLQRTCNACTVTRVSLGKRYSSFTFNLVCTTYTIIKMLYNVSHVVVNGDNSVCVCEDIQVPLYMWSAHGSWETDSQI